MNELRVKALLGFLKGQEEEVNREDITTAYGEVLDYEGTEYLVLTEEEADEKVKESIKESLWAFNPQFLSACTHIKEKVFKTLGELCEDGNEAVLALVEHTCGLDELVEDAIVADGRGHFLNQYDGTEEEIKVDGEWFFIYRY